MRRFVALTLVSIAASTPLAAQFEGTVTMKMSVTASGQGTQDVTMKTAMKGGKTVSIMTMPGASGPMAGMEMRTIVDPTTNTSTTLIPMPPGMASMPGMANAKGLKTVVDLSAAQAAAGRGTRGGATPAQADIKKLGTSETIAGMSCDDYEITTQQGAMRMCVTSSLGTFVFPQAGGMGMMGGRRGGSSTPAWANAFGGKPMFPLKVWSADGQMAMEVVAVDKSPVPASLFEIPDGYVDMAGMMGGMMRPPGL